MEQWEKVAWFSLTSGDNQVHLAVTQRNDGKHCKLAQAV